MLISGYRGSARRVSKLFQSGALGFPRFWIFTKLGLVRDFEVTLLNHKFVVRSSTPDVLVAASTIDDDVSLMKMLQKQAFDLIIDAGAYIGSTAIAFRAVFPETPIVSLEPATENFGLLKKNVGQLPRIHIDQVALVGSNTALGQTQLKDRGTGQWGFSIIPIPLDCPSAEVLESVPSTSLPRILDQFGVTEEGSVLVKLDIEGAELEILRSGDLDDRRVSAILVETHSHILPDVDQAFSDFGRDSWNCTTQIGEKYVFYNRLPRGRR